jgi:hypothetical protein
MSAVTIRSWPALCGPSLVLLLGVMAAACSTSTGAGRAATTSAPGSPTSVSVTTVPPTLTPTASTTVVPPAPQPSPDQAADKLIASWAAGDRNGAQAVASPSAVDQLFAAPYPGPGLAISRGCSAAFPPIVCTYGPPGGASPSDSIYQLYVSSSPKGWYVSSVSILG